MWRIESTVVSPERWSRGSRELSLPPLVAVFSSYFSYVHGPQLSRFENGIRNKIPESAWHYLSKSLGNMAKSFYISHFSNVKTLRDIESTSTRETGTDTPTQL